MRNMPGDATVGGAPERLIQATISLLAEQGPAAVKARTVASAIGLTTSSVYHHFGGIAELVSAVADHGFRELAAAFARVPVTDDPVADLFTMALACRHLARENPHLYDLMFGLSMRATYRPLADSEARRSGRSQAFQDAHAHVTRACERLVSSGRATAQNPEIVAAQLWSFVHGYVTLELAEHFADFAQPVAQILLPMGVNFAVALGDTREQAEASHQAVLQREPIASGAHS